MVFIIISITKSKLAFLVSFISSVTFITNVLSSLTVKSMIRLAKQTYQNFLISNLSKWIFFN